MYSVVSSLKGFIKFREIEIDNVIFQLHYRITSLILAVFSVILSTSTFFGDPIDCITAMQSIPGKMLDSYCWISSTFTLPGASSKAVGVEVPFPGVDKATGSEETVYHSYYQWVVFFLMLQTILFYVPRYIWKILEGERVRKLLMGLNCPISAKPEEATHNIAKLALYLNDTMGQHQAYVYAYLFCEVLNFVNVILQMSFTNLFLGGEFTTYGMEVIKFANTDQANRTDPMVTVFPKTTKCTWRHFGPSGDVQKYDALCVLPVNILNEKFFIFLWFWYIILAIFSALVVLYRMPLLASDRLRSRVTLRFNRCKYQILDKVVEDEKCKLGDWFILHLLAKNMDNINYSVLIPKLHEYMKTDKKNGRMKPDDKMNKDDSETIKLNKVTTAS